MTKLPDHLAIDIHYAKSQIDNMAYKYDYSILEEDMFYIFQCLIFLPINVAIPKIAEFLGSLSYLERLDVDKTLVEACALVKCQLAILQTPIVDYKLEAITDDWAYLTLEL